MIVSLRPVSQADLPTFFEHQRDPEALEMADFHSRDWDSFRAHWARILADEHNVIRTVVCEGRVAGNIVAWPQSGKTLVGYWLGREFWGQGIATQALRLLLDEVASRPLFAYVGKGHVRSMRVLVKCGFVRCEDSAEAPDSAEPGEFLYKLDAGQGSPEGL